MSRPRSQGPGSENSVGRKNECLCFGARWPSTGNRYLEFIWAKKLSLLRYKAASVSLPPCRCVSVSIKPCLSAPRCLCASVSICFCRCAPVSLQAAVVHNYFPALEYWPGPENKKGTIFKYANSGVLRLLFSAARGRRLWPDVLSQPHCANSIRVVCVHGALFARHLPAA